MKTLKFLIIPLFTFLVSCTIDVPVQGAGGPPMRPMPAYNGEFNPGNVYCPPIEHREQRDYYGRPTQYGGGNSPTYYGGSGPGRYNNGPNGAGQTIYHGSQAHHVYGDGPQYYVNPN